MHRILLLLSLLILTGCATILPDPFPEGTATWDIPVEAAKIENVEAPGVLPSNDPQTEMVITVPPSDKPTHIKVEKRHVSIKKKLLSNEPEHKVTSDNSAVTAAMPKKTLWWRWLAAVVLGLFIVCVVIMAVVNRVTNWSPAGFLKKLLRRG